MAGLYMKRLEVGMFGTNCYIIMDEDTKEGYIIDPGAEARTILAAAEEAGLRCKGVLCTHGHMDHVGAVGKVSEATGAPVYISETDSGVLSGSVHGIGGRIGSLFVSKPSGAVLLKAGETLEFGTHSLRVLATPGHTPGSLSFLCENNLFCGDLVFQGSIGRTDLRGGSLSQLMEAVKREVFVLQPEVRVFPGHGPATTVGAERSSNPFLRDLARES
jgi:glyoxylase-like metal-dependent hydrolase (beta-lactamase superfamily II)